VSGGVAMLQQLGQAFSHYFRVPEETVFTYAVMCATDFLDIFPHVGLHI
jgi:hypothetical protein